MLPLINLTVDHINYAWPLKVVHKWQRAPNILWQSSFTMLKNIHWKQDLLVKKNPQKSLIFLDQTGKAMLFATAVPYGKKPLPWWFECYLRRSSSIHCWLVLAVYRIISVNFLLQPFFFVNFGVYSGLPLLVSPFTMRRWKCLGMKRLSQPSSTSPGKRTEKLAEAKADVKRVMQNPGRVCFILKQKR